jgi:hypothetical protein
MTQQQTITWATQRILGAQTEPKIGVPKRLLFHTMVGSLVGTDSMFRQGGFDGTESTFGVGGPWGIDGERGLDGELWQWQLMGYQADANWDANADSDSVETADGGNPNNPWSSKQLLTLIQLTVDWCRINNRPCVLVGDPSAEGLGYHEQFIQWNHSHHVCPGVIREGQLRTIVIPKARALLTGKPVPPAPTHLPHPVRPDDVVDRRAVGQGHHQGAAVGAERGQVLMTQPIPPEILALTNVDPNDVLEDMAAEVGRLTKMLKASHRAMTQLVDRLADVQRQLEAANATVRELESELAAPARADETTGDETQPEVQP